MDQPRIVRHAYSDHLNPHELNYREEIQPQEDAFNDIDKWYARIDDGRRDVLPALCEQIDFAGKILELGAGSCWFSAELSKLERVAELYCLDMSEHILRNVAPKIMAHLGADASKITNVIGDFHRLEFPEGTFDFVVFDAALHHIPEDTFVAVMREVHRVLKETGRVVAIREPILSPLPIYSRYCRRKFGAHERQYGVTENAFTMREWQDFFRRAGFRCLFVPSQSESRPTNAKARLLRLVENSPLRKPLALLRPKYVIVLAKDAAQNAAEDA